MTAIIKARKREVLRRKIVKFAKVTCEGLLLVANLGIWGILLITLA